MSEIIQPVSRVAVLVGLAWVIQAIGMENAGLLSISPAFLFSGAVIAGSGTGAIAGLRMASRETGSFA